MKTTLKSILTESQQTNFLTSESEIRKWLDTYQVKNYTINGDLTVSVNDSLSITEKKLTEIPVKFSEITGSIDVTGNLLTRIDWAPKKVNGDFDLWDNEISSLEGGPEEVEGNFDCDNNKLTSLKGSPRKVGGAFVCSQNNIRSLVGCPEEVGKYFKAMGCGIEQLDALPNSVGTNIYLQNNKITTFKGINKLIKSLGFIRDGKIAIGTNPVESGLISIMSVHGVKSVVFDNGPKAEEVKKVVAIINKSLADDIDVFDTQDLLIDQNLGSYS